MRANQRSVRRVAVRIAIVTAMAVCGAPIAQAATSPTIRVAYLNASSANTWLQASKKAMEKVAVANNMKIVEFDAQFKPEEQTKQIADIIASGKYKGIVVVAINGPGLIPDIQTALKKGMKVVVMNQVVGTKLDTSAPQVAGVSASVLAAPLPSGVRLGRLTLEACGTRPACRIVYLYGIKGTPLDEALRAGFDKAIAGKPVRVVAEGEGKFLGPDGGIKAIQDILQKTPDFDVVVGSDQSIQGVAIALKEANKLGKVALVGFGGSQAAIAAVKNGTWFGDLFGAPADEGRLAMTAMVAAITSNKITGGIDPLNKLADGGLITKANVGKFTAQWAG